MSTHSADSHASDAPTNRLASETSPYLLQHKHNPVDWYPWGEEALARAREEDKPIFLSIGYSACHWCHVMERESFENPQVAEFLKQHFVSIKVDREERPDLDDVYMKATQILSGHGGWPMSVFLTPELKPFYAGTYFPPQGRYGQPAFMQVLGSLSQAWATQREQVTKQADKVVEHVQQMVLGSEHLPQLGPDVERPRLDLLDTAMEQLAQVYDPRHGGFGGPPKFPHADDTRLCLRQFLATGDPEVLQRAVHTLDCMQRGGIYDQLGGGFARYSTDGEWLVPHFEKMLYDNALLVPALLEAQRITGRDDFARTARECCEWVLREMVGSDGGLYSTQDADSEGEEGRFFVWQRDEVLQLVGKKEAKFVDTYWGLGKSETFEGHAWVLHRPKPDVELAAELGMSVDAMHAHAEPLRAKLFAHREQRVHPGTDDKVLAAWNGLMIGALAQAAAVLDEPRFLECARNAARFCLTTLRPDGRRLLATARHGKAHLNATLADYAYLANGLLDLHAADGDLAWVDEALSLVDVANTHFADSERAGWFFTSDDHEALVARPRDLQDGALPSSNGVMLEVLVRLHELTGDDALRERADRAFATCEPLVRAAPMAFARLLLALTRAHGGGRVVVLADGPGADDLAALTARQPDPTVTLARVPADGLTGEHAERFAPLAHKAAVDGKATAYPCRGTHCEAPVHEVDALATALGG